MFHRKTAFRSVALAMALAITSVCALAQITEPPRPRAALASTAVVAVTPKAAVAAANVKDVDQPARAPFQATVQLNINNFTYTAVPIPAGQRLVIEYVSISGAAQSNNGPVQPVALLTTTLAGNPGASFYFAPPADVALPTQFYRGETTAIYADTLEVGPGFAGYAPSFMVLNVVISGHLISVP